MYCVTKGGTYSGKQLDPGDALDVNLIDPSVVKVLMRQGLVRDISQDEADQIKAQWRERKKAAELQWAQKRLERKQRQVTILEGQIERLMGQLDDAGGKLERAKAEVAEMQAVVQGPAEQIAEVKQETETRTDRAILKDQLASMSSKQLLAYARAKGMTGDLPRTKVKLVPLILGEA